MKPNRNKQCQWIVYWIITCMVLPSC